MHFLESEERERKSSVGPSEEFSDGLETNIRKHRKLDIYGDLIEDTKKN